MKMEITIEADEDLFAFAANATLLALLHDLRKRDTDVARKTGDTLLKAGVTGNLKVDHFGEVKVDWSVAREAKEGNNQLGENNGN